MKVKSVLTIAILIIAPHYVTAQTPRINVEKLFNSQTRPQPIPQCTIISDQLPSFRGLKLGMPISQPKNAEPHRRYYSLEDGFGTKVGLVRQEDKEFLGKFDLKEVKSLELVSLNSKLVGYQLRYSRNAVWNSLSSILPKFSAVLNLPLEAWRTTQKLDGAEFESKMFCDGFNVVLTGSKTSFGSDLALKIETNYKNILETEKRELLRRRAEAFNP